MNATMELVSPGWHTVLDRYRKFVPQLALVLLYGWTVITDRLTSGGILDGVTAVGAILAVAQAVAVIWPGNPIAKAAWSLAAVAGQAVTAAVTDGHVSTAEASLILAALLAWATGAATPNAVAPLPEIPVRRLAPADRVYDPGIDPHHLDDGAAEIRHLMRIAAVLLAGTATVLTVAVAAPPAHAAGCPPVDPHKPWTQLAHDTCLRQHWRAHHA